MKKEYIWIVSLLLSFIMFVGFYQTPCEGASLAYGKQSTSFANEQSPDVMQPADTKKSDIWDRVIVFLLLVFFGFAFVGVVMGFTDKAIFYMNARDVVESFLPFILPFIVAILLAIIGWILNFGTWYENIPTILALFSAPVCIAYVYKKSLTYNGGRKFVALAVTCGKMILSFMCISLYNELTRWEKNQSSGENWNRKANAAIWLAAIIALMKRLVNGERVLVGKTGTANVGE